MPATISAFIALANAPPADAVSLQALTFGYRSISGVQDALMDVSIAQTPAIRRRLGERAKSTLTCPS
jgi:hypothetical protein